MITVNSEFLKDKFLEFSIFMDSGLVDIDLSYDMMIENSSDMEINLENIKATQDDDGTYICNLGNVVQYTITKNINDITLTGHNTVYILDEYYNKVKSKIPFTLEENSKYIGIEGISEYDKYLNLLGKLIGNNTSINSFYSNYIEIGNNHNLKNNITSKDKLNVNMLIYDTDDPEDDAKPKLIAVIVTNELNGINDEIYQIERGV